MIVRFTDGIGGDTLLDLTPGNGGLLEAGQFAAPPPKQRRSVNTGALRDGATVSASAYDLREVRLEVLYLGSPCGEDDPDDDAGQRAKVGYAVGYGRTVVEELLDEGPPGYGRGEYGRGQYGRGAGAGSDDPVVNPDPARRREVGKLLRILSGDRAWLEVRPDGAATSRWLHLYRSSDADLDMLLYRPWAVLRIDAIADPFALGPEVSLGERTMTPARDFTTVIGAEESLGDVAVPLLVSYLAPPRGRDLVVLCSRVGLTAHKVIVPLRPEPTATNAIYRHNDSTAMPDGVAANWTTTDADAQGRTIFDGKAIFARDDEVDRRHLRGTYRCLVTANYDAADAGLDWELRLSSSRLYGARPGETEQYATIGSVIHRGGDRATVGNVFDMGLVDVPSGLAAAQIGHRPSLPVEDLDLRIASVQIPPNPATTAARARHSHYCNLLVLPADGTTLMLSVNLSQAPEPGPAAGARVSLDPYTGQLVALRAGGLGNLGQAYAEQPRSSYIGAPPTLVPGQPLTLVGFRATTYDGTSVVAPGQVVRPLLTPAQSALTVSLSYWPQYLTVL